MLRACALWCALMCAWAVAAYTVDCNHEYTDCDTELSKLANEEDDITQLGSASPAPHFLPTVLPNTYPTPTTKMEETTTDQLTTETTKNTDTTDSGEDTKPRGRLLNLNVEELQNFADAIHNQTRSKEHKKVTDLSDVTIDEDEDEAIRMAHEKHDHDKILPNKFYSNLQAPFNPMIHVGSEESESSCKDNGIGYKIGEKIERGCEEMCECMPSGILDCTPRCKHPYIRKGRRLNDPLCFESPVDECCSIVACATGNGDMKVSKLEVCRYGNDTHPVGSTWTIGCEQRCTCEPNSVVTCKPRCSKLPEGDKCINFQDPKDACCEVQVCDVSQDVHEEPVENSTTSTTTTTTTTAAALTTEIIKGFEDYSDLIKPTLRPLVLNEPIGSIKVLQNNSVQVNLMHMNTSADPVHLLLSSDGGKSFHNVELKFDNLILNLPGGKDYILKTKETGTKFNFTITSVEGQKMVEKAKEANSTKVGCHVDDNFYAVGEEFHIACLQLCECIGPDTQECVDLVCPSHVGLELVSKGCVRWAPSPPATPPNCCPRSARCLSDGTCHYKGVAVPNWSEVPLSLTGCEQRCFCENGELDCQDVCSPLPPIPPQTLRCPPMHRPAPVNISEEDCCKQWGCLPNATEESTKHTHNHNIIKPYKGSITNYVTSLPRIVTTGHPPVTTNNTDSDYHYRHSYPSKKYPKVFKAMPPATVLDSEEDFQYPSAEVNQNGEIHVKGDNITVFTLDDFDAPFKTIHPDPTLKSRVVNLGTTLHAPVTPYSIDNVQKYHGAHTHPQRPHKIVFSDDEPHQKDQRLNDNGVRINLLGADKKIHHYPESPKKVSVPNIQDLKYFVPFIHRSPQKPIDGVDDTSQLSFSMFAPVPVNHTNDYFPPRPKSLHSLFNLNSHHDDNVQDAQSKHLVISNRKNTKSNDKWSNLKDFVPYKISNPYATVLMKPIGEKSQLYRTSKPFRAQPGPLDLENLVNQMEIESEVSKGLGRSTKTDKTRKAADSGPIAHPDMKPHQPFLPTIRPDIRPEIHFPHDDIPDYEQNNLHRPVNSLEPNLPLPPGIARPPNYGEENKKLTVLTLQADSPTSVKLLFGLPPVLVGLRGSVDLRYTDKDDEDITHWQSQVFAPADEVLTTPRLEFRLTGLKPSTTYKIRGKLYLHNLPVEPESEIYSIKTLDLPTVMPVEEKIKEIDSRLTLVDVNDTAAHVSWRHFTEDELRFIDGIQVRFRPVGTPIYSMTELLHHSRSIAELHDLRPGSRYEASLVLIPPPRATTELQDPGVVEFTTLPYLDPYNWTVSIEAHVVGSNSAELTWRGVPSPAERWVRVYRAAHACGTNHKEHDAFRLATRDIPPTILLSGLEANNRCRIWLELFLTNGKIKTSNVLEVKTSSHDAPSDVDNQIEASSISTAGSARGDYYGALVVVGVVAALGALTSLLLLLVLVRRHRPRSVPITPVPTAPRESSLPPYDNPAYKLELQQETMDL